MSSSLAQEALMVSFSSHWTMALMTKRNKRGVIISHEGSQTLTLISSKAMLLKYMCVFLLLRDRENTLELLLTKT